MQLRGFGRVLVLGSALCVSLAITDRARAGNTEDEAEQAAVTVFGAAWCSACHTLEQGLREKQIPFEIVDVDKNPSAFAYAKKASGKGSSIPLTGIARKTSTQWIVGADIAGVEKAYKGE